MSRRKFKPGRRIRTMARFAAIIKAGGWVYWNDKVMHPGWAGSWQFHMIQHAIESGILREANLMEIR